MLQLSAATINAEWLVGSMLGQPCQEQCASGSCTACRASASVCSEHKQPAEGTNVQKPKVEPPITQVEQTVTKGRVRFRFRFESFEILKGTFMSFFYAGIKQAEERAAAAREEEASGGKASAEVSPE